MSFPIGGSLAALLVAAIAAGMTCILLLRKESNSLHRALGGLLGATALANFTNGIGLLDEPSCAVLAKNGHARRARSAGYVAVYRPGLPETA